jgi:hypothetical protein
VRYPWWHKRRGVNPTGVALDAAKKLLGRLANRKRLGAPDTLVDRIVASDGSIVEARFNGDFPTVSVLRSGQSGGSSCTLYVESGMLDLGPNIAADAGNRFDRGLPEFDASPATLHFGGTGLDCADGMIGRIRVRGRHLSSECLADGATSVTSRLSSPAKKRAQAVIPASSFTGLMHRYVAAIYGGAIVDYELNDTNVLALSMGDRTASVSFGLNTFGLVRHGTELLFVRLREFRTGAFVYFYWDAFPLVFDPCAALVFELWKRMVAADAPADRCDKVLTIALSGCIPGPLSNFTLVGSIAIDPAGNSGLCSEAYGWAFAENRAIAVAAASDGERTQTAILRATFTFEDGAWSCVLTAGEWVTVPFHVTVGAGSGFAQGMSGLSSNPDAVTEAELVAGLDAPLYAFFVGEQECIYWITATVGEESVPEFDALSCLTPDPTNIMPPPFASYQNTNCNVTRPSYLGDRFYLSQVDCVFGLYATLDETVAWSDVSTIQVFKHRFDSGDPQFWMRTLRSTMKLTSNVQLETGSGSFTLQSYQPFPGDWAVDAGAGDVSYDVTETPGFVDAGEGVRTECTVFGYSEDIVGSGGGTGDCIFDCEDGGCDAQLSWTGAYYTSLAVAGNLVRSVVPHLQPAHGDRTAVATYRFESHGAGGNIVRSRGISSIVTLGDVEATLFRDIGAGAWEACWNTTFSIGSECSLSTATSAVSPPLFESLHTFTLSTCSTFSADGGIGCLPGVSEYLRQCDFGDFRGTERFVARMHMGATLVLDDVDVTGTLLNDPDIAHLGAQGELTDFACEDMVGDLINPPTDHDPIQFVVDDLGGTETKESVLSPDVTWDDLLIPQSDFRSLSAQRSLLGATVIPEPGLDRGASINMDRQTISGGYPVVSTPSFVGWA